MDIILNKTELQVCNPEFLYEDVKRPYTIIQYLIDDLKIA